MYHKSRKHIKANSKGKSAKASEGTGGRSMPMKPMKKHMDNDCPKSGMTCKM